MKAAEEQRGRVLVHCVQGVSRSVFGVVFSSQGRVVRAAGYDATVLICSPQKV